MDILHRPPQWLQNMLPQGVNEFLEGGGWYGVLGLFGLILLLLLWTIFGGLLRGLFQRDELPAPKDDLEEDLTTIPQPPPNTGDRRLTVEGVPVRLRLVVLAPAGITYEIRKEKINQILDRVVSGLGAVAERDEPRTRIWPKQLSYEGFAHTFHNNTPSPEGEDEPSRWVMVAGRAEVGGRQVMVGLGLQAIKPTTVGRRTLKPHEWDTVLRIKTREG
ncbi:MAG TPA: hypothetical protein VEL76_26100 [Gemmataceae bacterium]|nr:hypothetical protein [Gemmataceae bacterium]